MTQEKLRLKALELAREDMRGRISTHEEMLTRAADYVMFLSGLGADTPAHNSNGGCDPFRHLVIISLDEPLCSDRCSTIVSVAFSQLPDQVFSSHARHEKSPKNCEKPTSDSHSEAGNDSVTEDDELLSPSDDELQKWGFYPLADTRARTFLCQLPDIDLKIIRDHHMPHWLSGLLATLATYEIERRRDV